MKSFHAVHLILIMILCTFVLYGCSIFDAESHENSEKQQIQSTDESKVSESPQPESADDPAATPAPESADEPTETLAPESTDEPTASQVPEPIPEPLNYTIDGEEYEVVCNQTDFMVYSSFKELEENSELIVIGYFIEDAVEKDNAFTNAFEITQVFKRIHRGRCDSHLPALYCQQEQQVHRCLQPFNANGKRQ